MTFPREFLKDLQKRLAKSNSYPMTKNQVQILTKMRLVETDKNVIFDAISNDFHRNHDPLSLRKLWNDNINDEKLKFEFKKN
jgi:hypothetical protein